MRVAHILSGLSAAGAVLAVPSQNLTVANTTLIPKRFIIEVAQGASVADLTAHLDALNGTTVTKVFNSPVFSGVSVESADGNVDTLQSIPAAATVWPSRWIKLKSKPNVTDITAGPASAATKLRARDGPVSAKGFAAAANAPVYNLDSMTGVDKLRPLGINGKGAQVALISTGVEYTHPGLGGCIGPGCKIGGGWDFVGDGCWPLLGCPKAPNSDPVDRYYGWGTLAAGVIIGENADEGYLGVAPEATVYAYKVYDYQGLTDEETIIEAFLKAYDDGADVIAVTETGPGGFADDPLSVVASRLVDQGVVAVLAAGNDGDQGPFYASGGASGDKVLAVAATWPSQDPVTKFSATFNLNGESQDAAIGQVYYFRAHPMSPNIQGWPLRPLTFNTSVPDDACNPISTDGLPDFSEAVVIVRLGGCSALVKQRNLVAAGLTNIIFYWDPTTIGTNPQVSRFASRIIVISDTAGEAMVNTWVAGGNVTGNFTIDSVDWVGMQDSDSGRPAYSTISSGPLYDLGLKPDVAAPGDAVMSTYLQGSWSTTGGTSPAAAYVAGVAALYIGHYGGRKTNPNFNATDLVARIISSGAGSYAGLYYYNGLAPVTTVGTGLIDAFKVLNYTTQLSYAKFALNDTHNFERYHKVDITNNAGVDVTYTFDLVPAAGYEAWVPAKNAVAALGDITFSNETVPSVSFPSGFKVKAGKTKTAQINFGQPSYPNDNLPVYSGYIQINSSLGEALSVPYMGLATSLTGFFKSPFDTGYPYITSGISNVNATDGSAWSFNLAPNKQDFPKLFVRTVFGTDELRWDIFESTWKEKNWKYPPVAGQNQYVGSATYWAFSQDAAAVDPAGINDPSINGTVAFPIIAVQRNFWEDDTSHLWWLGGLADGTRIAPGKYVMRVAALLPFGDRTKSAGWSTYTLSFSVV